MLKIKSEPETPIPILLICFKDNVLLHEETAEQRRRQQKHCYGFSTRNLVNWIRTGGSNWAFSYA